MELESLGGLEDICEEQEEMKMKKREGVDGQIRRFSNRFTLLICLEAVKTHCSSARFSICPGSLRRKTRLDRVGTPGQRRRELLLLCIGPKTSWND